MVALSLLAMTLLGACGSLQFALRATRTAQWQARAVDLVADFEEDLQQADPALPLATQLESWRSRLQEALPAAQVLALDQRGVVVGDLGVRWHDLRLMWNGSPGNPAQTLRLPLAHAAPP
jgi:hypothetical protein